MEPPPPFRRLNLNFFLLGRVGRTIMLLSVVVVVVSCGLTVNDGRRVDVVKEVDDENDEDTDDDTEVKICGKTCCAGVCCGGVGVVVVIVVLTGGAVVVVVVLEPVLSRRRAITFLAGFLVRRDFIRCRRISGLVLHQINTWSADIRTCGQRI